MRAPVAKTSPLQAKNSFNYWVWGLLFIFIISASLFYTRTHMQAVELGYKIADQQDFKQRIVEENKLLNLEIAKLKDPHRLAGEAKEKLNFITPQLDQVVALADWKNSKSYQLALKADPPPSHPELREAPMLSQNVEPDVLEVKPQPIRKNTKVMKTVKEVAASKISTPKQVTLAAQKNPALPGKKEVKKLTAKPRTETSSSLAIAQAPKGKDKPKELKTKSIAKNTISANPLPSAKSRKSLPKATPSLIVARAPKLSDSGPAKSLAKPEPRLISKKNKETLPAVILDTMP